MFDKLLSRFRRKVRCAHPNLKQTRYISQDTPCLTSSCPDCGMFDSGPVMTMDTPEEWLNAGNR